MNGYIIPDVIQKDLTALKKLQDVVKVRVTEQVDLTSTRVYYPQSPVWLLATGYWNDEGFWDDLAVWID